MSLKRRNSLLTSSVFRLTIMTSAAFLTLALCLAWAFQFGFASTTQREVREQILEAFDEIERTGRDDGAIAAFDLLKRDGQRRWHPDLLYEILEEGDLIIRISNAEDVTLAGYAGLDPPEGWSETQLAHEELDDHDLISYRERFPEGYSLSVARFYPDEIYYFREITWFAGMILFFGVLPLSLIVGYFLSQSVFRRLNTISATAEAVGEGELNQRVPLRGSDDEFDRLSSAVNTMLDRLQSATREMRGVSVGIAHDLKTPVANIGGRLQLMERDITSPELMSTHIQRAQEHIGILLRTLDALLRLGEIESGRREAAFATVNLTHLVAELGDSFQPVFEDCDKQLSVDAELDVTLLGDSALLIQMLTNLLENIIEHGRDGAQGWMRLSQNDGMARLVVGDDGPGIAETSRDEIFARFYRADTSRNTKGNGLGLSLVKAIVELHDGTIDLCETDPGTVFEIKLPIAPSH